MTYASRIASKCVSREQGKVNATSISGLLLSIIAAIATLNHSLVDSIVMLGRILNQH